MPSALKQGSVVIAPIVPDAGRIKPRPAILLTPTPLVRSEPQLELVGVTGSYYPDDPLYFELPWTPDCGERRAYRAGCGATVFCGAGDVPHSGQRPGVARMS